MPYIGNQAVVGDSANTFKSLDDIASFTVTFDATDSSVVSIANNTLTFNNHRFVTGQKVTYNDGGGTAIGGLSDGSYFIIKEDQSTIKLASSASNATSGTAIDLTSGAAGGSHTLNIKFDGVNTKFKATHTDGTKAKVSRPAQITLSINGVIQQPTADYTIESDSTIVFSQAPIATDKIFASFIGEVAASFDLTDNTVDEFTANGSTTVFTLSKTVPSSNDVLVTLDGVTQYPTTQSNTRAYSVLENVLTFVSAPSAGVIIQVRHIGFAGATSQSVTGFYGRTGNVQLKNTDNVAVNNLTVAGNLDVTGDLTYDETVSRNLNVTGVATVASGIVSTGDFKIGTATTLSQDNIFTTGIITATSFVGSGANLTGVASTENIRTNTNATFLQNINVSGTSTVGGIVQPSSDSAIDIGTDSVRFRNAYVDTYYGDGSNLTGIAATANVRTGILDVAGIATFRSTVNVSNINDGQIGGRRNIVINGAMKVAQRATSSTSSGRQTIDRFGVWHDGTDEAPTQAQVDVSSGTTPYTNGFRKALRVTNGNQTSGAGADDYIWIQSNLEAQDIANSGWNYLSTSSFITLSFWVKSSVAQDFKCYLRTRDGTERQYPFSTGSLSADTWTKVTKTIPGNAGLTFDNNINQGLQINIGCFFGTNLTASGVTENAWGSWSSTARVPDMTSTWYTTNDATFEVTGIQLEVGSQATSFEHLTMGEELILCQRYYFKLGKLDYLGTHMSANEVYGIGMSDNDDQNIYAMINFPVRMRTAPTGIDQSGSAADYRVRRDTTKACSGVPTFVEAAEHYCRVNFPSSSHGWGTGQMLWCMSAGSSGYLGFGAEL